MELNFKDETSKEGIERTNLLKKNILGSLILKGISMLVSFLIVPITINYVNPTQYGIWLTLSSLMSWFYFFDIGLTNGFRNRFTYLKAKNKIKLARIYVSTTYAALLILFIVFSSIVIPFSFLVDWSDVLNISPCYREELKWVFIIMLIFFGLNIVFQTFSTLLIADQRSAISSFIQVFGQIIVLGVIYLITKVYIHGSLISLSLIFSGIPFITLVLFSIIFFHTKYKKYRPHPKLVKLIYIKDILGIGGKFFIVTTSMLFIYQLMNVIISREVGPEAVTQYNLSHKYFSIFTMGAGIILGNFWSAFTDAYAKRSFEWMSMVKTNLEKIWFISIPILTIMYFCATPFIKVWVNNAVEIPGIYNICMAIYTFANFTGGIYMCMINGIGKIQIQLIIYLCFALISYPLMTYCCRLWGIPGILIVPTLVYFIQGFLGKIQINYIITGKAHGYWDK